MLGLNKIFELWGVPASLLIYLGFAFTLFWQLKKYYFNCLNSKTDRKVLLAQLEAPNGWKNTYHARLQRGLDWLDRWLKPAHMEKRPELQKTTLRKAAPWFWSGEAMGVNLTIALIYPIILLLLFWVFGNINTSGIDGLLPENLSAGRRFATLTLLGFSVFSYIQSTRQPAWKNVVWLIVAVAFAGAFAVAVAGAGAVAGAVLYFHENSEKVGRLKLFFGLFSLTAGLVTAISFGFSTVTGNEFSIYLLVFLVTIPLVNAYYDYFSLGLTRFLLQKSLDTHRNLVWFALADFAAACVFLLALALTLVAAISGLNLIAASHGAYPVDIGGILSRLRHTPADISLWWIYIMIFSTFLPTFAHAAVAIGNMPVTRISKKWRTKVITGLKELQAGSDGHHARESGAWYFALQRSWSVVITIIGLILLGAVVVWFLPGIGRTMLFLCESLAEALGEDISPGRIFPFFGSVLT